MEQSMTAQRRNGCSKWLLAPLLLLFVVPAFLIYKYRVKQEEQGRINEEIVTREGLAKVISETFQGKSELKVAAVTGKLDVTSVNHGWVFTTTQRAIIPYSVDYFVNVAKLSGRDFKFDSKGRNLIVRVPDVLVAKPNIDEANMTVIDRGGWYRSATAGENLAIRASKLADRGAWDSAKKPERMDKARDAARVAIANLLTGPLQASGQQDVKVQVRFPTDGADDPSYLDLSTPYEKAIREAELRRAAEGKK